jgi:hypothetical protein
MPHLLRTLISLGVVCGLLIVPGASLAQTRKGDVLMKLGPPHQVMQVDGDEFWIYRWVSESQDPLRQLGRALGSYGAALEGKAPPPVPTDQHMLILRFGPDGELKAYERR